MEDTTDNAMDGVREASHVSASAQEELSFFVCQQCRYPIVSESEILFDKAEIFTDQVYSYEMEVLVDKTAWCYSATNPGAHRFDVLRIKKPPHGRVSFDGLPTLEHTWFPGHKWVYCQCGACGQHLGWGYCAKGTTEEAGAAGPDSTEPAGNNGSLNMETSASQVYPAEPNVLQPPQNDLHEEQEPDNPAEDEVVFCGLILTRLAPQSLTAADMATFDATLVRAASHSHLFQQHMQELVELLHSVMKVLVLHIWQKHSCVCSCRPHMHTHICQKPSCVCSCRPLYILIPPRQRLLSHSSDLKWDRQQHQLGLFMYIIAHFTARLHLAAIRCELPLDAHRCQNSLVPCLAFVMVPIVLHG
eukprot:m.933048 g.933048  ORF g.933048 m.933048 type:complete len:359 (-) comp23795_c0_seq14:39-1115(-)